MLRSVEELIQCLARESSPERLRAAWSAWVVLVSRPPDNLDEMYQRWAPEAPALSSADAAKLWQQWNAPRAEADDALAEATASRLLDRYELIQVLEGTEGSEAYEATWLLKSIALSSPDADVRKAALLALGRLKNPWGVKALTEMLRCAPTAVKAEAAQTLEVLALGNPGVAALKVSDPVAVGGLAQEALPVLREELRTWKVFTDGALRRAFFSALRAIERAEREYGNIPLLVRELEERQCTLPIASHDDGTAA